MSIDTVPLIKVACPVAEGNPNGYYMAESLPRGAKLYKESNVVVQVQPEQKSEPVIEEPIVEPEPVAKTIIEVDIPDTKSNAYFNAMTDEELKAYLDSNKVKYHHLAGRKTLFNAASAFANLGAR